VLELAQLIYQLANQAFDRDAPFPSRPLQGKARAGLRCAGQLRRHTAGLSG